MKELHRSVTEHQIMNAMNPTQDDYEPQPASFLNKYAAGFIAMAVVVLIGVVSL